MPPTHRWREGEGWWCSGASGCSLRAFLLLLGHAMAPFQRRQALHHIKLESVCREPPSTYDTGFPPRYFNYVIQTNVLSGPPSLLGRCLELPPSSLR